MLFLKFWVKFLSGSGYLLYIDFASYVRHKSGPLSPKAAQLFPRPWVMSMTSLLFSHWLLKNIVKSVLVFNSEEKQQ